MNRAKFQKSLQALTGWRERAFILALAERALPNVVLFLQDTDHSDGLFSLMSQAWSILILEPSEESIVDMLDRIDALMPEESDMYGSLPTRDCLMIWEQALLAGLNEDKKRAFDASLQSVNTIIGFVEFSEGEGKSENQLIKLFDTHPLMEREFSFQSELSDFLRTAKNPSKDLISEIRALAQDEGISNIGICLD